MNKHLFRTLILMAAFVMVWVSLPTATATITADACDSGDHIYELIEKDDSGYGSLRYFDVEECEYVPYEHQHYFVQSVTMLRYSCKVCGYNKTVYVRHDDTEFGEFCTLHDFGR